MCGVGEAGAGECRLAFPWPVEPAALCFLEGIHEASEEEGMGQEGLAAPLHPSLAFEGRSGGLPADDCRGSCCFEEMQARCPAWALWSVTVQP